jgi:hypothetical protein
MTTSVSASPLQGTTQKEFLKNKPIPPADNKLINYTVCGLVSSILGYVGTVISGAIILAPLTQIGPGFGIGVLASIPLNYFFSKKIDQWNIDDKKKWELKYGADAASEEKKKLDITVTKVLKFMVSVQYAILSIMTVMSLETLIVGVGSVVGFGIGILASIPILYFIGKKVDQLQFQATSSV